MKQYSDYITGLAPEVPPNIVQYDIAAGQAATIAQRERDAYYYTARLAFDSEAGYRDPLNSAPSQSAVQAIYSAAGLPAPSGNVSKAQLLDALFRQVPEDPNTYVALAGPPAKVLQFMAGQVVMANYLNYERYIVERRNYLVNSAALALATRNANFSRP